jgi:hypothetical protein
VLNYLLDDKRLGQAAELLARVTISYFTRLPLFWQQNLAACPGTTSCFVPLL